MQSQHDLCHDRARASAVCSLPQARTFACTYVCVQLASSRYVCMYVRMCAACLKQVRLYVRTYVCSLPQAGTFVCTYACMHACMHVHSLPQAAEGAEVGDFLVGSRVCMHTHMCTYIHTGEGASGGPSWLGGGHKAQRRACQLGPSCVSFHSSRQPLHCYSS